MKKVAEFIKKRDNLIVILILILLVSSKVYNAKINNNDELINFLNIYKMANGMTIYKDTNVIITPLFFYIGQVFLKIFGTNLLIFRTYNLIISTLFYFLVYKILKTLKINKGLSLLYTILTMLFTYNILPAGANYNIMSYCIYMLGLLLILKMQNGNKKDIMQGIILFLVFFCNQKLSAGYFLVLLIYNLSEKNIKSLIKQLAVAGILLLIYCAYLICIDNLYNFINYTILGIKEFAKSNTTMDRVFIQNIIYILVILLTLILYILLIKTVKDKGQRKIFKTMIIFSIGALIINIPILNGYHIILSAIIMFISLIYGLNYLVEPIIEGINIKRIITLITLSFVIILSAKNIYEMNIYKKLLEITDKNSPFYGALVEKETREQMHDVSEYIKNNSKETIILSTYAPFYSIYLNDLENGVYDWPLKGNLGIKGEEGLIEDIKNLKDTQILLYKSNEEQSEIYQYVYEARDYIKNNMKFIGNIGSFDIYETIN